MNTSDFVQSIPGDQSGRNQWNRFWGHLKNAVRASGRGNRKARGRQYGDLCSFEFLESRCLLSAVKPSISISDATIVEGDSGTVTVLTDVTLSQTSELPITVRYATRNRTSWAGFDYQAKSGTLTIPAGQLSGQLSFTVIGDLKDEQDESFYVSLSSPTNATISRNTAIVTIEDNDPPPSITASDVWVTEGNVASFRLWFSQPTAFPVTIAAATLNGTAVADSDFIPFAGNIQIPASVKSYVVNLNTVADTSDEPTERFSLRLNSATNATLARTSLTVNIADDDPPEISISDVIIDESDSGDSTFSAAVRLSSASDVPVTFQFQTQNITAIAGLDYVGNSGSLTIAAGRGYVSVRGYVKGDTLSELNETFGIALRNPVNAVISRAIGIVTIRDDDPKPVVSVANAVTTEGENGSSSVTVSLSKISGSPVTVDYEFRSFTATVGIDVNMPAGTLTIPAGQLSASIPIVTVEDTDDEPDEAFRVVLSNPVGLSLGRWASVVTIQDDDGTPLPLFELSDLSYLGAFKLPSGEVGSATFSFAGGGIAFNPLNNSLFMASDSNVGLHVAEVAIPSTLESSGAVSGMTTASILQQFVNLGGLLNTDASGAANAPQLNYENVNLGGLLVTNGGLTGGMYTGYTGAEPEASTNTHFRTSTLDLSSLTSENFAGLLDIRRNQTSMDGRIRGGYMTEVPEQWQPYIGANFVTGAAAQNIIQLSSSGPALFAFDAENPEGSSGNALLAYPHSHPLQWSDQPNSGPQLIFNGTTKIDGVTFVPGTRSIIFIGSNGLSNIGYGEGSSFNDSARPYSGYHAQDGNYAYQIWAYDIEDFMAVRHGVKSPWTLQPTSVVNFDLPTPEPSKYLGGTAFDAETGRLYISQKTAGVDATPVIHVYQLGRQSSGSSPGGFQANIPVALTGDVLPANASRQQSPTAELPADRFGIAASGPASITTSATSLTPASSSFSLPVSVSTAGETQTQPPIGELQTVDDLFGSLNLDLSTLDELW